MADIGLCERIKCDSCNGKRLVMGLGGMPKTCLLCEGMGYVSLDRALEDAVDKCEAGIIAKSKARRGKIQKAPCVGNISVQKIQSAVNAVNKRA